MEEEIVDIIHDNPESSIIIQLRRNRGFARIDVDERYIFEVQTGPSLREVDISPSEKAEMKKRRDLKHSLMGTDIPAREVYTISRIGD